MKWCGVEYVGDSSGKSKKPLNCKLENYPETQDKSPTSILRLLPSYTSTKVISGVSLKGRALLSGEYSEETLLLETVELVLEIISTCDLQLLINQKDKSLRKIK